MTLVLGFNPLVSTSMEVVSPDKERKPDAWASNKASTYMKQWRLTYKLGIEEPSIYTCYILKLLRGAHFG